MLFEGLVFPKWRYSESQIWIVPYNTFPTSHKPTKLDNFWENYGLSDSQAFPIKFRSGLEEKKKSNEWCPECFLTEYTKSCSWQGKQVQFCRTVLYIDYFHLNKRICKNKSNCVSIQGNYASQIISSAKWKTSIETTNATNGFVQFEISLSDMTDERCIGQYRNQNAHSVNNVQIYPHSNSWWIPRSVSTFTWH